MRIYVYIYICIYIYMFTYISIFTRLGNPDLRPQADVVSYNTVISSCEKAQKWQEALVLLTDLEQWQMHPARSQDMRCKNDII